MLLPRKCITVFLTYPYMHACEHLPLPPCTHEQASKKSKKNINVGRAGDLAGGLDDYKYDDIGGDDDGG